MNELQLIWGWQPALYLFLGGMGAGAFVAAAVLFLVDREHNRNTIAASMWAAMISLGIGLVLLLTELVFPTRGLMLWQSFSNWTSWMTFGAWVAFAAIIVFALTAALMTDKLVAAVAKKWKALPEKTGRIARVFAIVGLVLGVCVAVYTGMLLMAVPGVPLWDTPLLPCLFTVSALDTGVALVEIISLVVAKREELTEKARRLLETSVVVLVVTEALVLLAFVFVMLGGNGAGGDFPGSVAETAAASIGLLVSGQLAPYFWILVVACGLALPLVVALYCLVKSRKPVMLETHEKEESHKPQERQGMQDTQDTQDTHEDQAKREIHEEREEQARSEDQARSEEQARSEDHAKHPKGIVALGATGALAGGCALRFLILMAGLHADYVADMILKFF